MANIKTDIAKYEKQKISRTGSPKSSIGFAVLPLIVLSHYRYYRTCMYCGFIKEIWCIRRPELVSCGVLKRMVLGIILRLFWLLKWYVCHFSNLLVSFFVTLVECYISRSSLKTNVVAVPKKIINKINIMCNIKVNFVKVIWGSGFWITLMFLHRKDYFLEQRKQKFYCFLF